MDRHDSSSGELGRSNKQIAVDKRFNSDTAFWREACNRQDAFGEVYRRRQAILLKFVDELGLSKDKRILEIGCGLGHLSLSLADRGFLVNAVDHASAMIEEARIQVKGAGMESRVHVSVDDVHHLSFPASSFDLVVGLGVVPWLYDLKQALAEIERVLKTDGYVILSIDNSRSARLYNWFDFPAVVHYIMLSCLRKIRLMQPKILSACAATHHLYSIDEFDRYLRGAGLEPAKYSGIMFGLPTFFYRDLFPSAGVSVLLKLQQYSEGRFRVLRRFAAQYVHLAVKRSHSRVR
jgi:ubiquinone/menaquinone biosynthesis C-methylase UbiE